MQRHGGALKKIQEMQKSAAVFVFWTMGAGMESASASRCTPVSRQPERRFHLHAGQSSRSHHRDINGEVWDRSLSGLAGPTVSRSTLFSQETSCPHTADGQMGKLLYNKDFSSSILLTAGTPETLRGSTGASCIRRDHHCDGDERAAGFLS